MKIAKTGRRIALAFEPWQYLEFVVMVIFWVLSWFVISVVVFLRRDFGERYLSWLSLFFGYTVVGLFAGLGGWVISWAAGQSLSWLMGVFYFGFVALSLYHRYEIHRKNKAGIEWHSLYSGTPLLPVPVSVETMNKWVEPGVLFALGVVMALLHSGPIAVWLLIASGALLLHEHISYHLQRERLLDLRDARIESAHWQAALKGKSAAQNHGFAIASSNLELLNRTPELRNVFESLAPDVRAIMDEEEVHQ